MAPSGHNSFCLVYNICATNYSLLEVPLIEAISNFDSLFCSQNVDGIMHETGLLILRAVAEPRISSKSAKSRKIRKNTRIPRKPLEILPNTCRHNIFESYLGCWGCLLAVNLLIYLQTSSPQRVNNIPKLPGVLRLMLQKTGKQRCKNPGVPRVDLGNWGGECDSLFYRVLALHEEYCVCEGLRLIHSSHRQR